MDVPGIVESTLDGEEIAAQVSLGGEDELYITPSRTLIYRAEGILSDESVEEYAHDADRLVISEGRRKTRFSLEYPLDGTQEFTIPSKHSEEALHPVLAGLLNASGVTDPGETVLHTYWFSELTLVITSERLVKHIGEAVWDDEYEEFPFADLTGIEFERGEHATQLVLECNGRKERIKIPSDASRELEEHLKRTLYEYYDVSSMGALREKIGTPEEEPAETDDQQAGETGSDVDFGGGIEPLDASPSTSSSDPPSSTEQSAAGGEQSSSATNELIDENLDTSRSAGGSETRSGSGSTPEAGTDRGAETRTQSASSTDAASSGGGRSDESSTDAGSTAGAESTPATDASSAEHSAGTTADGSESDTTAVGDADDVAAELDALREQVEKQNKLIAQQQQTLEQLIEELRRGL